MINTASNNKDMNLFQVNYVWIFPDSCNTLNNLLNKFSFEIAFREHWENGQTPLKLWSWTWRLQIRTHSDWTTNSGVNHHSFTLLCKAKRKQVGKTTSTPAAGESWHSLARFTFLISIPCLNYHNRYFEITSSLFLLRNKNQNRLNKLGKEKNRFVNSTVASAVLGRSGYWWKKGIDDCNHQYHLPKLPA